ncbi:hypothetical protein C066_02432 [Brucella sp. UK5/01]|nr:hypothetical protein C066_02432 [Brucella sp. UK5/01]ENT13642.1 hypothetical protein C067_02391 [Brucella sp. F8/99]ENT20979.1 hypothetical protein C051_02389 [Brucella sp. UK40/99]
MGALTGYRVLDMSRVLAGPWCGQILADLGAEVIKIERPRTGDDTRDWGPPWMKDEQGNPTREASYYQSANRGKFSVALNIASPEGQDLLRKMVAECDVLIENYKAGSLAKYGLDYETLSAINPGLVYCSVTGFGQTGPRAPEPGYDFIIQGIGGLMSITGERDDKPGGGPQKVGVAVADLMTGLYSAIAIEAALLSRAKTGKGSISIWRCLMFRWRLCATRARTIWHREDRRDDMAMHMRISCPIRSSGPVTAISLSLAAMMRSLFPFVMPSACRICRKTRVLRAIPTG